ncbi:BnaCnng73550D [Brassica napus]|uniref:BnaCnng73550D protein n=1 Tax=Brassica napus TaxID=3708 RepID=A0A078JYT4_BRANA|nr:BnaCnng73550D [Brassica napus]
MEGSDVTFNIAGDKFQAHKLVLAARSPFFKSKFSNELEPNSTEVTINDLEPKVFKALLQFIYKDSLPEEVEPTLIVKLLAAADKYYLNRLRLLCESHICKGVSVKSVAKILALAHIYKATELKSVCLKLTAENLAAVLETDGYQQQKDECLSLQSELLKAVAAFEESSHSIGGAMSLSVWAQLSDGGGGGDTSSRHVRQRTT